MRQSPVSKLTLLGPWLALMGVALASACTPTCEQTCRKLLFRCEFAESEQVRLDECEESCQREEALYDQADDREGLREARAHRRCVSATSCDDLAAGECYGEFDALFPFEIDESAER